jgi:serine protease Do
MGDGESYDVDVVARDVVADIAVLQIRAKEKFPYLEFGDSDHLSPGQTVVAIGNALGEFRNSVSVGVVSGLSRSVSAGDGRGSTELLEEVIQTDAAINPGNSGGPLLNNLGQVIGVNIAVALGSENIGFALPANIAHSIVLSVERYGKIVRPYIGVRYVQVTPQLQKERDLPVSYGALVIAGTGEDTPVLAGSPAARAGLREGDIILSVDGVRLEDRTLSSVIRNKEISETVELEIMRGRDRKTLELTLESAPS